jgi:hypothetical protein
MSNLAKSVSIAAAAFACAMGASAPANAVLVATICGDAACALPGSVIVQDNGVGDTSPLAGGISFSTTAFGYTFLVNSSQSKPLLGSATLPQLDLSFVVTSGAAGAGNVFLYASDTDFVGSGGFLVNLGGTNSVDGSVIARAWGGTTNTQLQFSGANLLGSALGPFTTPAFSGSVAGAFTPTANPYSLTIGVQVARTAAGTSTGDLNLLISPVPEPSTWALMLMGPALMGFVARRRRARG